MSAPDSPGRSRLASAARVAAVATLLIAVVYVGVVAVLDVIVFDRQVHQVDARLRDHLRVAVATVDPTAANADTYTSGELDDAPVFYWRAATAGARPLPLGDAPVLPPGAWTRDGRPVTATVGTSSFRTMSIRSGAGWLIAGQSVAEANHARGVLVISEAIAGPVLLVATFLGLLVIGLKASSPVELARRRQLEFTADASHELRTPLSVIDAEISLALGAPRQADQYREVLDRISNESGRLRRIVEDLLFLARFDSEPAPPGAEPVDLAAVAAGCADRFGSVAVARAVEIVVRRHGDGPTAINAPPEWVDRLAGVLVDNACRHAGTGGAVHIVVGTHGARVSLAVEDSGPGIPPGDRDRLFDRFHRSTEAGGAAGLGLAIADSIVRSTGGRWRIGDASIGGARMEVVWHRSRSHARDQGIVNRDAPSPRPATGPTGPRAADRAGPR
ncbi:MAG TPA: HAMP domain-containing sensor histidine kinase [Acidimicrobiales bacterium]|nr:HAMP domain-containing sensor histidine kinase [Acidimicrobiales bacterium]